MIWMLKLRNDLENDLLVAENAINDLQAIHPQLV
jgi:hypothetical protein